MDGTTAIKIDYYEELKAKAYKYDELINDKESLLILYLKDSFVKIENKEMFEHGYPESRLIPSNFYEDCKNDFAESVADKVYEEVKEIICLEIDSACYSWRD